MWAGSISHNGMTGLGQARDFSVHQFGHELSGMFDIPHAESLSAIWPAWAGYVAESDVSRFAKYAREIWDVKEPDDQQAAQAGIRATEDFFRSIGMPVTLGTSIEKHHERKKERYGSNPDIVRKRTELNYHLIQPRLQYYGEIQTRIEKETIKTPADKTAEVRYNEGSSLFVRRSLQEE